MDKRKLANQQVKDRLLAALIDFAGRKDWSKVTVTELVEQAGVARASFYRNFSSVEDLVDYGIRQVTQRYHEGMPTTDGNPRSRERIEYQFRFYQEHASLVLGFHRAKASTSLLDLVTDCEIASHGDMSASSPERYQLYFYAGAFYNMLVCWLESGLRETPEALADEFLRLSACHPGGAQRTGAGGSRQAQAGGPAGEAPDLEYQTGAGDPRGPAQS